MIQKLIDGAGMVAMCALLVVFTAAFVILLPLIVLVFGFAAEYRLISRMWSSGMDTYKQVVKEKAE